MNGWNPNDAAPNHTPLARPNNPVTEPSSRTRQSASVAHGPSLAAPTHGPYRTGDNPQPSSALSREQTSNVPRPPLNGQDHPFLAPANVEQLQAPVIVPPQASYRDASSPNHYVIPTQSMNRYISGQNRRDHNANSSPAVGSAVQAPAVTPPQAIYSEPSSRYRDIPPPQIVNRGLSSQNSSLGPPVAFETPGPGRDTNPIAASAPIQQARDHPVAVPPQATYADPSARNRNAVPPQAMNRDISNQGRSAGPYFTAQSSGRNDGPIPLAQMGLTSRSSQTQNAASARQQAGNGGYGDVSRLDGTSRAGGSISSGPTESGGRRRSANSSDLSALARLALSETAAQELNIRDWIGSVSESFEIVRSLSDRQQRELHNDSELMDLSRSYVKAIESSLRSAEDGVAFSRDAIDLCNAINSNQFSIDILTRFVDDMCKMADDAYTISWETQTMFREIRQDLYKISSNTMNAAYQNPSSSSRLQSKLLDDGEKLQKLIGHLNSCISWWSKMKSDLASLRMTIPYMTLHGENPLRGIVVRQRWESVHADFRLYIDEVNRIQDSYQPTIQLLNNQNAAASNSPPSRRPSQRTLGAPNLARGSSTTGSTAPHTPMQPHLRVPNGDAGSPSSYKPAKTPSRQPSRQPMQDINGPGTAGQTTPGQSSGSINGPPNIPNGSPHTGPVRPLGGPLDPPRDSSSNGPTTRVPNFPTDPNSVTGKQLKDSGHVPKKKWCCF